VTGIPRSGTTWVARLLARSPGTSMLGREPMNPRAGQFALGGRLHGWARLEHPDDGVARTLRRVYAGREPRTFGRYGVRQWRAAAQGTCLVVKDPFALLSVQAVAELTGAVPVVVFRSAAETLSSYRRMGWTADTEEFAALGAAAGEPAVDAAGDSDDVAAMARFWGWGYDRALDALDALAARGHPSVVVSHAELTVAGIPGQNLLRGKLGLDPVSPAPRTPSRDPSSEGPTSDAQRVDPDRLHNFDRSPEEVLAQGRANVDADEAARIEGLTAATWARLTAYRLAIGAPGAA
jgi:hypothetical protein